MTRRYLKLAIAGSLFTLTACAQQSEIRQMHQSVSTLSQEMTQLNQQTIKITQQNALNAKSTRGVYLLPEAKTPARLESQIGTLRMSVAGTVGTRTDVTYSGRIQRSAAGLYRHRRLRTDHRHYPQLSGSECSGSVDQRPGQHPRTQRCQHPAAPERNAGQSRFYSRPRYPARRRTVSLCAGLSPARRHPAPSFFSTYNFSQEFIRNRSASRFSVAFCQEMHRIVNAIDYACSGYVKQHVFL